MSTFNPKNASMIRDRKMDWFHHESLTEWGYDEVQMDTFAVLYPSEVEDGKRYPLYVVFHSAGHDIFSAISCTLKKGNHDIYHAPTDMFALYLDCRQHEDKDWWWGGDSAHHSYPNRSGVKKLPVENRAIATVEWVMENFPIDKNRVYAVGNSMGGSGALGIAMCRGDIFVAVKANVPAGVYHMADRCCLHTEAPEEFKIPDPPILVDYSAQNDSWSAGHEVLYRGMRDKKYAIFGYFGNFGHANNHADIREVNDLIHSFDIFSVRLNEPYPVFTNADSDDMLPWAEDGTVVSDQAGQVNSFFRWGEITETDCSISVPLRLLRKDEWESRVEFPLRASADVSVRRLQNCRFSPGETVAWKYNGREGTVTADENGLVTVPGVEVSVEERTLVLTKVSD